MEVLVYKDLINSDISHSNFRKQCTKDYNDVPEPFRNSGSIISEVWNVLDIKKRRDNLRRV